MMALTIQYVLFTRLFYVAMFPVLPPEPESAAKLRCEQAAADMVKVSGNNAVGFCLRVQGAYR